MTCLRPSFDLRSAVEASVNAASKLVPPPAAIFAIASSRVLPRSSLWSGTITVASEPNVTISSSSLGSSAATATRSASLAASSLAPCIAAERSAPPRRAPPAR